MCNRLIILVDNRTENPTFTTEHGLSVYLETGCHKILLDTGSSDAFIKNAAIMGVDLEKVDYVFISHGHNDHIGGLPFFLEINKTAKIIVSPWVRNQEYYSKRRYLHSITGNVDFNICPERFIFAYDDMDIDNIHIHTRLCSDMPMPKGNCNLFVKGQEGKMVQDDFCHEMALYTEGLLFTGCAHHGIMNILNSIKKPIRICIGGFHLLDGHLQESYETDSELKSIASNIMQQYADTEFYTGHCTGDRCFEILKVIMDKSLHQFHCGDIVDF